MVRTALVIPSYEPDEKLIGLLEKVNEAGLSPVVVVNDGSVGKEYDDIFEKARNLGAIVLWHAVNMGKGRALKTAFNYCLNEFEDLVGVVTADSDGQHSVADIKRCIKALEDEKNALILGCRNFDGENVPSRSEFGNKTTSRVMKVLTGIGVSDTQTGLRGIPKEFMKYLLTEKGERFEFETNMLLATKELGIKIVEVPIETIYLEGNKTSHFNPIRDSFRIYVVFLKFIFSSLSSSVVDACFFMLFCHMTRGLALPMGYIMLSTILARVISATYNFLVNYKIVFKGKGSKLRAALGYCVLAIVIMLLSGTLVTVLHGMMPFLPEIVVKIVVDTVLFFVSFWVQREVIYAGKNKRN